MKKFKIACSRCKESFVSEIGSKATEWWEKHPCNAKGFLNVKEIPSDLLDQMLAGKITQREMRVKIFERHPDLAIPAKPIRSGIISKKKVAA